MWTLTLALILVSCITPQEIVPTSADEQPPITKPTPTPTVHPTNQPTNYTTAANADVTYVRAVQSPDGTWTFHVTVTHPDTGWQDYADGWDVLLPDGTVLKPDPDSPFTRLLLHPHEAEQPFTRSQSNIVIPKNITQVTVRAHDLVDGFGGKEITVDLTVSKGENYEIIFDR